MRQADGKKVTRLTLGRLPLCPSEPSVREVCYRLRVGRQIAAEAIGADQTAKG